MYFAGTGVALTALFARPRPVDETFVADVQAQSTAPTDVATGKTPATLGARLKAKPFNEVGIPLPAVAAKATEIVQLVAEFGKAAQFAAVGAPPAPASKTQ